MIVDVFGSGAAMDCRQDEQRFLQLGGEVQPGRARWQRRSKVSKPLGSCFPSYQLRCAMYIVRILCINIYICLIIMVFFYNIYMITKFHTQDYQQWWFPWVIKFLTHGYLPGILCTSASSRSARHASDSCASGLEVVWR